MKIIELVKTIDRIRFSLVFSIALLITSTVHAEIRVGLSSVDITPPVGGLTQGYSSAKPTEGVHDPVSARVIVLQSVQESVAMVVCDLCVYNSPWLHDQMSAIGVDRLLLMNTHTHAGPKLSQEDFPTPEEPWRNTVDQRLLAAIKEAQQNLFRGYFKASQSQIQLGYNRLVQRGDYAVTHFENPQRIPYGSVDPQVGVIRVTDEDNRTRAVLVTYACHPVVLGPRNRQISADYPGVMREIVEQSCGDDCMCIFIQGAGGDINPLMMARGDDREKDFDVVRVLGETLAAEVQRALAFVEAEPGVSESFSSATFHTQFRNRWERDQQLQLGVTTLLINDQIAVVTLPGEPFHQFQRDFRSKSGVEHSFLFGYCCNGPYDWPRYLPDLLSAARGGYGASDTTLAEVGAGERLLNEGLVQLFTLQGRLKPTPQRHTFQGDPPK
ncbi:MAG: neutral/alkaline non-lysosomal ceramidase N-terminal domain-containing protein [Planctomycetales bacterium]|nr:neutral/alkaline non-lysosomal ceramidase N-terminal domain-containing protein [Planctomycetales bacterium]